MNESGNNYQGVRSIVDISGAYLNAKDLINRIEDHKRKVATGKTTINEVYKLAHDHIIEIIKIYSEEV